MGPVCNKPGIMATATLSLIPKLPGPPHLDGPVEGRSPPAQHEQAQDGDAVTEVVDEGHVVNERVRVSHEHDDCRGPALGETELKAGSRPACSCFPTPAAGCPESSPSTASPTVLGSPGPAPHLACLPPPTYADEEGWDGGAASDMDHSQQAGQMPFSGPREAQPGLGGRQSRVEAIS